MKFVILGCGSSMGVPRPDGYFGNCDPKNKKNYRTRCSALIKTDQENILIDTSPDLRNQMLSQKIKKIDKVFYSHIHADQTHGINDLRSFFIRNKKPINVFADNSTSKYLKKTFSYCFDTYNREYPATLKLNNINKVLFIKNKDKDILVKPIKVQHGNVYSICYIVDKKLAYISDVSKIFEKDYRYFKNLKYLIIDCLWYRNHPAHFNFEKSLEMINRFSPKKAILTNLHTDIDYEVIKKKLPKNIIPAYDGLTVNL
ncbi:MBL fold metallo-hydrolase [Candidatus Pelagibacter bacterium nBUS_25]|uniref:MBL fold metallo-hydrolase n=1 Tax=Candidatus Pelagibacter bacterium nBUS_25 TaxID=3374187 RepID=UPI003EBC49FD